MQETYTIVCPKCKSQFDANRADIPAEGRDVRCSNCFEVWRFKPDNSFDEHGGSQQDTPKHENFFESASVQKLEEDARKAQETADLNRAANAQQEAANPTASPVESPVASPETSPETSAEKSPEEITTASPTASPETSAEASPIESPEASTANQSDIDDIFNDSANTEESVSLGNEDKSPNQDEINRQEKADADSIFDRVAKVSKELAQKAPQAAVIANASSSDDINQSLENIRKDMIKESSAHEQEIAPEEEATDVKSIFDKVAEANKKLTEATHHGKSEELTKSTAETTLDSTASPTESAEESPEESTSNQSDIDDIFGGITGTDINEAIAEEASPETSATASPEESTSNQSDIDDIFGGVTGTDINEAIAEEASPTANVTESPTESPEESTSNQSDIDDIFGGVTGTDINEDIAEASDNKEAITSKEEEAKDENIIESKELDQKELDQEETPKKSETSEEAIETLESEESTSPDTTEEQKDNDSEEYDLISPSDGPLASSEKNENHLLEALNKADIAVTEDIGDPIPHKLTTGSKAGDDLSFIHDAPSEVEATDKQQDSEEEEKVDQDKLAEDWEKSLGLTSEEETEEEIKEEAKEEETEEKVDQDKLAEDWEKSLGLTSEEETEEEIKEEATEEKVDQDKPTEEETEDKSETEQLDDKPFKPIETAKPKRKRGFFGSKKTLVSSADVVDIENSQEQVLDRKPSDDLYPDQANIDPAPSELNPLQEESLANLAAKKTAPEIALKDIPGADTIEKDTPQQEQPAPPKRRVPNFQVDAYYADKEHLTQRKAALMSFFCLAALLFGVYALITQAKNNIVKMIPETGILYQISGQEIPPFESSFLEILQPSVITSIDNKLQHSAQVRGIINNSNSTLTQKIPFIVAEVFNQSGDLINSWQIEIPEKELLAGSSVTFLDKERPISENSNYIKLKLYYKEWIRTNNAVFANNEDQ